MKKIVYNLVNFACLTLAIFACKKDDSSTPDCSTLAAVSVNATNSACGAATGGLEVTATGGQAPLQYSIDGTSFQASNSFTDLAAGDYTVTIKDASGCTATTETNIESDAGDVSYESTIKNIISTNCAISGCHAAGTGRSNFTDFATIQSRAAQIKIRTGNRSMPLGRTLTDEQIQQIACWVDAGAPNN